MRDYKKEYRNYHALRAQKINRAKRNLWNRRLKGKVPPGKEIDHIQPLSRNGSNERGNIRYRNISSNRSRTKTAMWEAFFNSLEAYACTNLGSPVRK